MGKLYQFPAKYKKRPDLKDLFVNDEVNTYYKYFTDSDDWQIEGKRQTLYDGYPDVQPCNPVRCDIVWYVNHQFDYGTWVINSSKQRITENGELVWGWSPFVRKSSAPVHEPLNLTQREMRNHVAWIVDEDGYGQYGLVTNTGDLWVPHPKPDNWRDHNEAYGN
jgi:hypothetical protein